MINLLVRLVAVSNCLSIVIASAQGVPKIRMFRTPLAVPTLKIRKKEKRDAKVETTKIRVGKSLKKVKLDLSVAGVKCLCLRGHDGPLYTDELTWIRSNNEVDSYGSLSAMEESILPTPTRIEFAHTSRQLQKIMGISKKMRKYKRNEFMKQ